MTRSWLPFLVCCKGYMHIPEASRFLHVVGVVSVALNRKQLPVPRLCQPFSVGTGSLAFNHSFRKGGAGGV